MDVSEEGGESEDEASQVVRAKAFAAALKTSGKSYSTVSFGSIDGKNCIYNQVTCL